MEQFTDLNEHAKELVQKLGELHHRIGSYQKSKEAIDKTNSSLVMFIDETKDLSEKILKIMEKTNNIGFGLISNSLKKIFRVSILKLWIGKKLIRMTY